MVYYQIARIEISLYCHERMTTVASTKMILIYLILAVFGATNSETEDTQRNPNQPTCFQFSWLGLIDPTTVNCTKITNKPCLTPFVVTDDYTPPNVTWMWNNIDQTSITCSLAPGNACMKYSYTYDNAVVNISYFCGKMIEDKTSALTSGCYNQKVDGHIIEVCACQSGGGTMPCNSSVKANQWISMLIVSIILSVFIWTS